MLMADEARDATESDMRDLKIGLLTTGVPLEVLFPELVSGETKTAVAEQALEAEGPIEWVSAEDTEEAYEVLEQLGLLRGDGKLSADDLFIDPALLEE